MKNHKDIIQGTDAWHHIRKGKITGTTLKAIMGTSKARQDAIYEVISQRLRLGLEEDENAMERGTRLEPEAIARFEFETGLQVDRTGFLQKDDDENIAQSPDGLIGETEAIEVKCPGGKNYVKMWLTNTIPDEYYWQVVQYFVVNEKLEKLYFVGYNPDIPTHDIHIIEVKRKKLLDDIQEAIEAEQSFLKEVDVELSKIITL